MSENGLARRRSLHRAAALLGDGNVLLADGELESSPFGEGGSLISTKSPILFHSRATSFSETGDTSSSRDTHTATPLTGVEVLVVGGQELLEV